MKTKNITDNFSKKKLLNSTNDRGMTLIELLVVLGILAALAGMTLSFVSEMNSSARQNVTKNKLEQIEAAIIGENNQTSRFINDMGRLPVAVTGNVLSELWDSELFNTDIINPTIEYKGYKDDIPIITEDSNKKITVSINGGWKGPYLNVTNKKLYDGFGNDFHVADPSKSTQDQIIGWDDINDAEKDIDMANMVDLNPDKTILKFGSFGEDDQFNDSNPNWQNTDVIKEFRRSQVFSTLHVNILLRDSSTNPATWLPPMQVGNENDGYDNLKTYKIGSVIKNGTDLFVCTSAHSVTPPVNPPSWNRSETLIDGGGREWVWLSRSTCLNRLRVTVFSPYVTPYVTPDKKITKMKITTAFFPKTTTPSVQEIWEVDEKINPLDSDESYEPIGRIETNNNSFSEVTFYNLTPGIRKIFAYGYVENGDSPKTYSNARHSHVQTIELKSGENFITIYLNESFFD